MMFKMLNGSVRSVLDSTAHAGNREWLGRTGLVPEMAGEQELNFSSSERERLVQYPVEIPAPVFSPRKDPET